MPGDEESHLGLPGPSPSPSPSSPGPGPIKSAVNRLRGRATLKRRPTAVRVVSADHLRQRYAEQERMDGRRVGDDDMVQIGKGKAVHERTPLIKAGVKPDVRLTRDDVRLPEVGLGRMVELGLPLIM